MKKALLSTRSEKDFGENSVNSLMSDGLNLEKLFIIPEMTSVDTCCTNAYQRRFQKECPCLLMLSHSFLTLLTLFTFHSI